MKKNKNDSLNEELKEAAKNYKKIVDGNEKKEQKEKLEKENKVLKENENNNHDKKSNNKIAIIILIILILSLIFLMILKFSDSKVFNTKVDKNSIEYKEALKSKQDKIIGIDENSIQEQKENYTKEYKQYEQLTEEQKEKQEVIPRKEEVPYENLKEIKKTIDYDNKDKIPSKFNLKDVVELKVENQDQFGLCWDFASMKSLETNMALKNKVSYDVSEIHLDYMESNLLYGTRDVHDGGNFNIFEDYSIISGAILESDAEYRDYSYDEYMDFPNKNIVVKATETVNFPSINKDDENYDKKFKEYLKLIKTHIMKNGSLYAQIATPDSDREYYNPTKNAEYYDGNIELINKDRWLHAISIVGWDDNYSKDNFSIKPKHDGAFIALNSWDNWWGNDGYFYISYEDEYVYTDLNGVVSTSLDKNGYIKISDVSNDYLKELISDKVEVIDGEEYISKLSFSKIYENDFSNKNINNDDLKLIKYFNSDFINLSNNPELTDLSSLEGKKYAFVDLSNNPQINGYENISADVLYLTNNNIIKLPSKIKAKSLVLDNNKNIDLSTIPTSIESLKLSECNITDITKLPKLINLSSLDLSNNNIKNLDGIENISGKLNYIDLSNNKINNFELLNKLSFDDGTFISVNLSNNSISNIDKINNLKITDLDVSNNKISDVSNFNNEYITMLNLSNNNLKSGVERLGTVEVLFLSNCGISNVDFKENSKLNYLDLSSNNISNISFVNKLNKLSTLSLSNNPIKGKIKNNSIEQLSIDNCSLDSFDTSELPKLINLSFKDNSSLNNLSDIINNFRNDEYIYLNIDNVNIDESTIDEIYPKLLEKNISLVGMNIIVNTTINEENIIDFSNKSWLKEIINYNNGYIDVTNGEIDYVNNLIAVNDSNIKPIEVKDIEGYGLYGSYISPKKIIINY